jgi:maleylacetoacetate isomerase
MKVELFTYWRSSSSYRVRIALGYKGLAWTPRYVNLLEKENKKEDYAKSSPTSYVPCLVVDGKTYVESVAICELLDELAPSPPFLPKSPEDRARVRALVEIINAGTQPLQNLSVLEKLGDDKEVRVAWLRHFIGRGLAAFEALADARGPFAFGEAFTLADAFLVPQVYAARRFGVDLAPLPRVVRAETAALELPFVDAARPEKQGDARAST